MSQEITTSNFESFLDESSELVQALLNTCQVSDENKNILNNLIQNTSINNITFNDLNTTNQELYKALLNTCSISDNAKRILCNMLNNESGGNNYIDIPMQDQFTVRIIINNSRTLNITPRQMFELENSLIRPVIIDTIELDDIFYKKIITASLMFQPDNNLYTITDNTFYITYISDELDKPFIRTRVPDNFHYPIFSENKINYPWDILWHMYNLSNNYIPLKICNHSLSHTYSITDMYKDENNKYIITITKDEDSSTLSFMCDVPDNYPILIENNESSPGEK